MTNGSPAGWYSDPAGSGGFRYWDGTTWSEQPAVSRIPKEKRHLVASLGSVAGILIAVAPLLVAFLGPAGTNGSKFDESSGSGAAFWLIFMTVPLGFGIATVGVVLGKFLQWRERSKLNRK